MFNQHYSLVFGQNCQKMGKYTKQVLKIVSD